MAQKKKVLAKSPAGTKPKARTAATAKPARKVGEAQVAPPKKQAARRNPQATSSKTNQSQKIAAKTKTEVAAKAVAKPVPAKPTDKKASDKVSNKNIKKATQLAPAKAAAAKPVAKPVAAAKAIAAAKPVVGKAAAKPAAAKPTASAAQPAAVKAAQAMSVPQPAVAAPQRMIKPAVPAPAQTAAKPAGAFKPAGAVNATQNATRTVPSAVQKPAMRSFPSPVGGSTPGVAATPREIAQKAAELRQQQMASAVATAAPSDASKKPVVSRHGFKINESIVYPAHGVGRIVGIEEQEIAGMSLELFVIQFEKDKMTLRVPTGKLQSVGMRKLAEDNIVTKAMETLKGRARVKRTMWSRRAQEYEAKINSGDLISIAEVVRDLYRSESQPEQSYSERQLYEAALDRMAREIAAVSRIDERGAAQRITEVLSKSAKGRRAAEDANASATDATDGDAKAA